jgi:hypothetical protein
VTPADDEMGAEIEHMHVGVAVAVALAEVGIEATFA